MKDRMKPSVYGVGYLGEGSYKTTVNGGHAIQYACWTAMIRRCYYKPTLERFPTYEGCAVCEEWKNYQNFAKWYDENYPKDGKKYYLDKDQLSGESKIYSPETCQFVTAKKNSELAHCKEARNIIDPNGVAHSVVNVSEFCRDNGLDSGCMIKVLLGKQKQHKGFRAA